MELSVPEKTDNSVSVFYFTPEIFKDRMTGDTNSGRGWYQVYTFSAENETDENELVWSLDKNERLALVLIDISCGRERPLNSTELRNTERILRFFAAHGKEMILRPLYDREGKGKEKEPESLTVVLEHIRQIGELIKKYSDNIHTVQGLFVGSWGEMHSSKFLSDENMIKLAEAMLNVTGGKCFLSVRTPLQRRIIERGGIETEKTGIFDDGLFGSGTHLGTFGYDENADSPYTAWTAGKEIDYIDTACRYTPNGGEALDGGDFTDEEVLDTLRRMHISYLNRIYDKKILERWKNTFLPRFGLSMYDYIGIHLGYRFFVEKARAAVKGGEITVYVCIKNEGFGCLYRKAEAFLKIANERTGETDVSCAADLRRLASGESVTLEYKFKTALCEKCRSDIFLFIRHENGEYIRTAGAPGNDLTPIGSINCFIGDHNEQGFQISPGVICG